MMFLASVVATLMARRGILGCAPELSYQFGLFQIVVGILGVIAFGWSVIGILRPRELPQMAFHRLLVSVGNVNLQIPAKEAGRYVFPTSHPSYALVELTFLGLMFRSAARRCRAPPGRAARAARSPRMPPGQRRS